MPTPPDPYVPPPPLCRVDVHAGEGITRVEISGEIDLSTAALVEQRIEEVLDQQPTTRLIVDLRGLEFMDSTGLRLLVMLRRDSDMRGYELVLVRPPSDVYRPIDIAGLGAMLDFVDEPPEATPA